MSNPSLYLTFKQGSTILVGQQNSVFNQNQAVLGITFPNRETTPVQIIMTSSAPQLNTFDTLTNVKLYLTGDPSEIETIQAVWPSLGGGLQISFDGGRTYTTFSTTYGYQATPSTWVLLPAEAIGLNGSAGVLGFFDSATLVLKYVIPSTATQYGIYTIMLTADFDVN